MPFSRNKCSLLIDIAWLKNIEARLDYRLASLSPIIQAPQTMDYEACTISDDSWTGKHEHRNDHMIYLTLSHSLEVLFLFAMRFQLFHLHLTCLLVGGESWALKWQMLSDHIFIKNFHPTWKKNREKSLDCRVYGWEHGHFARLDWTQWPGFLSASVITKN